MELVVEDGTGLVDANSFVSEEDADLYAEAHVNSAAWTDAAPENKIAALQMATRVLDATWIWNGLRKTMTQALGWPRLYAIESSWPSFAYSWQNWGLGGYRYYDSASVPKGVKDATCEMARELLISDRTADADERGIKSTVVGPLTTEFDPADRRKMLPDMVRLLLRPFGKGVGSGTRYKTVRRV